jgi:prepilin-type N-terminal cleavage/methylation domain-containing protein
MEKNKYENNGFSLIELVVVISVLSILSSIALSLFNIFKEKAADTLVKVSMVNSFKECKTSLFLEEEIPTFTLDLGLHSTNGYYQFYQEYDYKIKDDGTIPSTILGNCIGPLGPHRIGVKKVKGSKINGELSINLDSGEKLEKGGLSWN